jgi:hypothetical protein
MKMSRHRLSLLGIGVVLTALACASAGEVGQRPSGTFIAEREIANSTAANAFELIQNLRPRWLHDRGQETFGLGGQSMIVVYLDGTRMGGLDSLRQISARDLATAERLNTGEATRRWGTNHPRGAIVLTTK